MSDISNCPNCNLELKSGFISSNNLLPKTQIAIINEYHENKADGYCTKCGKSLYSKYEITLQTERNNLSNYLKNNIKHIPVISTHSPLNWDYKILEMVTGQSTTGTGVITEFTSSFTDLFGAQSERHNQKLKTGENMCFSQLRIQALDLEGNAIIATDIDYSEIGAAKGMLMVCMAGTVIKLNNMNVLEKEKSEIIDKLFISHKRLKSLRKYK